MRDLNAAINQQTAIGSHTEFVYTRTALRSYMLLLQNLLTGFLAAFAALLLVVAMIVLGHSVSSGVEQERDNMAILKTMGYTSGALRTLQMAQYGAGVLMGMTLALCLGRMLAGSLPRLMVTSTGLLMPAKYPWMPLLATFAGVLLLLFGFILLRTRSIVRLAPVEVLSRRHEQSARRQCHLDKRQSNSGENPDLSEMRGWDFFITKKQQKGLTKSEKSAAKPFETRNSKGAATHGQIPDSVEGKSQQAHRRDGEMRISVQQKRRKRLYEEKEDTIF